MKVYVLTGSQGAYSDNSTWVEGVTRTLTKAQAIVNDRPLREYRRREIEAWTEDSPTAEFDARPTWYGSSQDHSCPGYCNHYDGAIDWTIEEWTV